MRKQAILCDVKRRDDVVKAFAKSFGFECVKEWDGNSLVAVMGNLQGCDEIQKTCLKEVKPYIYIDHGYFRRGYDKGVFRFCVNNYHCTDWRDSDRKWSGKFKEWKKDGKHVIVLPPAPKVAEIYNAKTWVEKTLAKLKNHTDRKIILKPKGKGNLPELLDKAHAVVSFGSVADMESAMLGVPVFTSAYSPAVPVSCQDLSLIETPIYPDRGKWLRSLAACEWHLSELDKARERIWPLLPMQNCKQQ